MPHPDTIPLMAYVVTGAAAVFLAVLFIRGWMIEQVNRRMDAMETKFERWKVERAKEYAEFREKHESPWHPKKHVG